MPSQTGNIFTSNQTVIENWVTTRSFAPNAAFGTVTTAVYLTRRVGDSMECRISFTNGTVTGGANAIAMPSGLTVDTTKIASGTKTIVGSFAGLQTATFWDNATGNVWGYVFCDSSDSGNVFLAFKAASTTALEKGVGTGLGSTNTMTLFFTIPISQWSI